MTLIPKIIHFVWLGNEEYTELVEKCMASWRSKLEDYEIIKWDDTNMDIESCQYATEAYSEKKYAFVSDYIRLKALYQYGGIYLDTDVEVLKKFDDLLDNEAFAGFENNYALETSVIGSRKGNPLIKEFLDYYENRVFLTDDGKMDLTPNPIPFTQICVKHGLKTDGSIQSLKKIKIFTKEYFSPYSRSEEKVIISDRTYSIHYFNSSWMAEEKKKVIEKRKLIIGRYGKLAGYIFYGFQTAKSEGISQFLKEVFYFLKLGK